MGSGERTAEAVAEQLLRFIELAEGMKSQTRTAWTSTGREESVAEHSWRLALLAMLMGPELPGVDQARLVELCLVHDLGEVFEGDISAPLQGVDDRKESIERDAVHRLAAALGKPPGERLEALWEEYNAAVTPEARAAKALDKIETIIQHNQGANPPGFDYTFNLDYGAALPHEGEVLQALRRLVDEATARRAGETP